MSVIPTVYTYAKLASHQKERKRYHKDNAPSDDIITLINLVRQNPALYNYKLQPNQRRRTDVLKGWAAVAAQFGDKYSVEECRRKWKNLRDTYHQYRLRKPKYIEGRLAKWRYAKDLEFLSTVYQPKLKSQRTNNTYESFTSVEHNSFQIKKSVEDVDDIIEDNIDDEDHTASDDMIQHHHHDSTSQILVDDAETYILTAYEEKVNGSVATKIEPPDTSTTHRKQNNHDHHHHDDSTGIANIESLHVINDVVGDDDDEVDDVDVDVNDHDHEDDHENKGVKNGHNSLDVDDDGATGTEVDYEEVCLYEEAGNPRSVDCEMGVDGTDCTSPNSKSFHYIDANDFCIGPIVPVSNNNSNCGTQFVSSSANNILISGNTGNTVTKLKNLALVTTASAQETSNSKSDQVMSTTVTTTIVDVADDISQCTSTTTVNALETKSSFTTPVFCTPTILQLPPMPSVTTSNNCSNLNVTYMNNTALTAAVLSTPAVVSTIDATTSPAVTSEATTICTSNDGLTFSITDETRADPSRREEIDLFFDFLKTKTLRLPSAEITRIQIELLNCLMRCENNIVIKDMPVD